MNDPDPRREQLERLIDQALRTQPPQRAPATLDDRVWAEIGRRATLPWWRRGFAHWPAAARLAFMLALLGIAWLTWVLAGPATTGIDAAVRSGVGEFAGGWPATLRTLFTSAHGLVALAGRAVPEGWLYGIAAAIGALYVACFGLGAATYRLLQARS